MSYLQKRLSKRMPDPEFRKAWMEEEVEYRIARNIIRYRKNRGLTQKEFASRLNTRQSVISRIEQGEQNLSIRTLKDIADVLGTDLESIISKEKKEPKKAHYKLVKS